MTTKPKIIFFGTPEFALPVLDALCASGYPIAAVVTAPDAPVGRKQIMTPPPVKVWAQEHNIPALQPETLTNYKAQITNYKPELGVVAAYGKIIPSEVLMIPKYGFLNVHPSLLPKYRGPTPIQSAILNGETVTGVTIHLTTQNLDAGPILAQKRLEIRDEETYKELYVRLAQLGAEVLLETIPLWIAGSTEPKEQGEFSATYTRKFSREDGRMDFNDKTSNEVLQMVRALNPDPGTFAEIRNKSNESLMLKILNAQKTLAHEVSPGKFSREKNRLFVGCKDKQAAELLLVQPAGRKPLNAEEFLRGYRWIVESRAK